jgi:hypothetical protein
MPFYFRSSAAGLTATTSVTDQLRMLTVANQRACRISGVYGAADNATVGGIILRGGRFSTASTAGSALTPVKADPDGPAANTTVFTGPTAGTTFNQQIIASVSQTGGGQPWYAIEPDAACVLDPNGGANGNFDVESIGASASMAFDLNVEFSE